jgi:hypothetical protein
MATTEELVALVEATEGGIRLEAARQLATHELSPAHAARVAGLFTTIVGDEWDIRWPLHIAARGLVAISRAPARDHGLATWDAASERALATVEATADPLRAEILTGAIEDAIAAGVSLDPRLRTWCERWADRDDVLGSSSRLAIAGFRHRAGEDVRPAVYRVDLGEGDEPPFPFAIAGVPIDSERDLDRAPRPPGLAYFRHQFGGYACLHETWLGYGVALPPQLADRVRELAAPLWGTRGESLTAAQLEPWAPLFQGAPYEGWEALMISRTLPPLPRLGGWPVLEFTHPWRDYVELAGAPVALGDSFGDANVTALRALGLGEPGVAILWGNSD